MKIFTGFNSEDIARFSSFGSFELGYLVYFIYTRAVMGATTASICKKYII